MITRPAACAGSFYPADRQPLQSLLEQLLKAAPNKTVAGAPKVLIVPHAGYIYSGQIAATAYRQLQSRAANIERVVLLGPCHRVPVNGIATADCQAFQTPLGTVELDTESLKKIEVLNGAGPSFEAHRLEHSLEVQLPFLQYLLKQFVLLPLVVGETRAEQVAQLLERFWGDDHTLIIISTDLSHFHRYDEARAIDADTIARILNFDSNLNGHQACGCRPLNGLLSLAQQKGLQIECLAHGNSGDSAGDKSRVVGYASFILQ